ncbi:hypothetical protein BT63DRAFT_442239 [Microthyrium microscopicum]|uniref:Uncharacterized protein n=1 Tax=Microthyrium microscopicum TaxID=703497 RepID=A0A6A6U3P4_9PEZI|nr:hypothetical protein BT63DRAFT_442239 [Microthyrium microscopicum]
MESRRNEGVDDILVLSRLDIEVEGRSDLGRDTHWALSQHSGTLLEEDFATNQLEIVYWLQVSNESTTLKQSTPLHLLGSAPSTASLVLSTVQYEKVQNNGHILFRSPKQQRLLSDFIIGSLIALPWLLADTQVRRVANTKVVRMRSPASH